MSYIGAGEGLRPFEPPTAGSPPLAPSSPPPLPLPWGKLSTTTARAPPSERKALAWLNACATYVRHRGFLGGAARWSDPTLLTPRGGNRRSFLGRSRPGFPAPMGRSSPWRHRSRRGVRRCPAPGILELCRAGCHFRVPGMPEHSGTLC